MKNIYVLSGEEVSLKDMRIKDICSKLDEYELESIYVESYRTENYTKILEKANIFLGTYDFFNNSKVLKIVLFKPEQIKAILKGIDEFDEDNIILFDLRCPEFLTKILKLEYKGRPIEIEKFHKFKDYDKDKVFEFMKKLFLEKELTFNSDKDMEHSMEYLFNNSQNSYSFIYSQINKISLLKQSNLTIKDILSNTGTLSNKNHYRICDEIFYSNNLSDLIDYMDASLSSINIKSLPVLINIFIGKLNDYILLSNGKKCKNKVNYYILKNSKIKISNADKLIIKLNSLALEMKKNRAILKEEFIWTLIEYLDYD